MLISRTWQQKAIIFLLSWHAVLDRNAHGISESAGGYSTSDPTQSENCLFKGFSYTKMAVGLWGCNGGIGQLHPRCGSPG